MITEFLIAGAGVGLYRCLEHRIKNRDFIRVRKDLDVFWRKQEVLYPIVDIEFTRYGLRLVVSLSQNTFTQLEKLQEKLEIWYGAEIEIERNENMKTATIYVLKVKLTDKVVYEPYKTNSHELFLSLDNKFRPMVVDMYDSPHVIVHGSTGSGKSEIIKLILTNLLHFHNDKEINIHFCNIGNTEDFVDLVNCKQVKSYVSDINDIIKQFQYMLNLYLNRMELFRKHKVKNIKQYNNKFKNSKMTDEYLVIDEIANLYPTNKNIPNYDEKVEAYNMLNELARLVRKAGIFLILGIQRSSIDVFDPSLKTNICTILGFNANNTASSLVAVDTTELAHIGKRKFLGLYDCNKVWSRSLYITDDIIKDYIANSVTPNRESQDDFNIFLKDKPVKTKEDKKKNKAIKSEKKSKIINIKDKEVATGKVSRVKNVTTEVIDGYEIINDKICIRVKEKIN